MHGRPVIKTVARARGERGDVRAARAAPVPEGWVAPWPAVGVPRWGLHRMGDTQIKRMAGTVGMALNGAQGNVSRTPTPLGRSGQRPWWARRTRGQGQE